MNKIRQIINATEFNGDLYLWVLMESGKLYLLKKNLKTMESEYLEQIISN